MSTVAAILKHKGYQVSTIDPTASVSAVAATLAERRIGAVLVMDRADQLMGIVSERDIVRALAEPLSKIDKVTIVSTGNGHSAGAHKLTGDITEIAAQVPALFEALSGMKMSELLGKVRAIGDKAPKLPPPAPGANS